MKRFCDECGEKNPCAKHYTPTPPIIQECCAACNAHFGPGGGYNEACWTCPCHMGQESKHDYDVGFETGKREGLKEARDIFLAGYQKGVDIQIPFKYLNEEEKAAIEAALLDTTPHHEI